MEWTREKIEQHKIAARYLDNIKKNVFQYIKDKRRVTEYEVQQFILKQFKEKKLKTTELVPIVAFGKNTSYVHYHPSPYSRWLQPDSLILIDIWARLKKPKAPYADITWMAYFGRKIPANTLKIFNIVIKARNKAIEFMKNNLRKRTLPIGKEIDTVARDYIAQMEHGENFLHNTGHSLGILHPHGVDKGLTLKNQKALKINTGYTIEPGIYIKNKFGVRSEIDFYINKKMEMVITTKRQFQIVKI
jgi:Xaa-Pro dipeptidase